MTLIYQDGKLFTFAFSGGKFYDKSDGYKFSCTESEDNFDKFVAEDVHCTPKTCAAIGRIDGTTDRTLMQWGQSYNFHCSADTIGIPFNRDSPSTCGCPDVGDLLASSNTLALTANTQGSYIIYEGCAVYPPGACNCAGDTLDQCGVCGGDNTTCMDCKGTPNGVVAIDQCGDCGGDNNACMDCAGTPNGAAVKDQCGECNGNNSTCKDTCGVINGPGDIYVCGCSDINVNFINEILCRMANLIFSM
jgi:hypothetical protein